MSQTRLDEFTRIVCPRCGRPFSSEKAVKRHLAWHRDRDIYIVQRFFDEMEEHAYKYNATELATFLKAVRDGYEEVSEAIRILSKCHVFKDLIEALRGEGVNTWRSRSTSLLESFIRGQCMESVNNIIAIYCERGESQDNDDREKTLYVR